MLLLWLLLVPSVRATIECHSACGLCAMDTNPLTAACTLCRECHKIHQRHIFGPHNQKLSRQDQALKDLEKREFRQVMKEYGWVPEDLVDSDSKVEKLTDDKCLPPPSTCINDDDEQKLAYRPTSCPTLPTTLNCPPATQRKKRLNIKKRKTHQQMLTKPLTKSTMPIMVMKQIMTLQYEEIDQDSPTETTCPDSEANESEEPLYHELVTHPTTTTTCRPRKRTTAHTIPCVPCMPLCALPCGTQVTNPPILPSIPPEALLTLKPTTIDDKTITKQKIQKLAFKHTSNVYVEETTKDYVYLYVGIPKHERYV